MDDDDSRITPGDDAEKITPETKISKRSTGDNASQLQLQKPSFRGNRHRRSPQSFGFPGFQQPNFQGQPSPTQQFPMNPYQVPNFGGFSQQNANGNALGQSSNPFFNQNAGANTQSSNVQNPFGSFQNTAGSSLGSNLANNGLAGQLSAANTNQQSYLTALGAGQQNNAQGQSANFDPFGNLQTAATNAGNLQTIGADGIRNQANGAANAHNQNQFGNSDSGAQTLSETFEGPNGLSGQKASSSSHASQTNQYGNFPGNPAAFPIGNPALGGAGMFPGFPQQPVIARKRRSIEDAKAKETDEKAPKISEKNGAQTLTGTSEGLNGLSDRKASSSSHTFNRHNCIPGTVPMFPGFCGNQRFYQNARHRHIRSVDAVQFPEEDNSDEKRPKMSEKSSDSKVKMPEKPEGPEKDASNGTKSEEPDSLDSRFGLPGHPVRTFLRETLGGIFTGNRPQERGGYGAYDNGKNQNIFTLNMRKTELS